MAISLNKKMCYNTVMSDIDLLEKKSLFWDTDPATIDLEKNKRYVIERVLRFGGFDDFNWLKSRYSTEEITTVIQRERSELDKKSLNFWSKMYNLEITYEPRNA